MSLSVAVNNAEPVVSASDVVKVYGAGDAAVRALDYVSIDISPGTFCAIVGPSGSGKSTLLHCLTGLDRVTSGSVVLGGTEITMLDDRQLSALRREHVGFVFQTYNLVPTLTALQNILLPLDLAGLKPDLARLDEIVASLGLGDRLDRLPAQLSGGQQQRVAIARALIMSPTAIFADEPTGALDAQSGQRLLAYLRRCCHELGHTVVMVTHHPHAAEFVDRAIVLSDGRVTADLENPSAAEILAAMQRATAGAAVADDWSGDGELPRPAEVAAAWPEAEPVAVAEPEPVRPAPAEPVPVVAVPVEPEPVKAAEPVAVKAAEPAPVKPAEPEPVARPKPARKSLFERKPKPAPVQVPPVAPAVVVPEPVDATEDLAAVWGPEAPDAAFVAEPVAEAPVVEAPVVEAPVVAAPVIQRPVVETPPTVDEWEERLKEFDRLTSGITARPVAAEPTPAPEPAPPIVAALEPEPEVAPTPKPAIPEDEWEQRLRSLLDMASFGAAPPTPAAPAAPVAPTPAPAASLKVEEPVAPAPVPVAAPPEADNADDWIAQLWAATSAEAGIELPGAAPKPPAPTPPAPRKRPAPTPPAPQPAAAPPVPAPKPAPVAPPTLASPKLSDDLSAEDWVAQWWAAHETPSDN